MKKYKAESSNPIDAEALLTEILLEELEKDKLRQKMTTENFNLKQGDPIINENAFGDVFGFYDKTTSDKSGIRVWYTTVKGQKSGGMYSATLDEVREPTKEEIEEHGRTKTQ
jgi:hypothetical protein